MDAKDIVKTATERFEQAKKACSENYQKARDDLYFISDEENCQWDSEVLADRKNRPVYQIDQLSQFIHQVENDERMNTPSITIIPDDDATDVETAEILQGLIRGIEYKSNADAAYDNAGSSAIRCGIGFIRVDHGYIKDNSFEQEILIKRVVDPLAVFLDPESSEADGSDAKYCFVLEEISTASFKEKYPDAEVLSFGDVPAYKAKEAETVTIAEYFYIEEEEQEFGLTESGDIQKKTKDGVYKSVRKISKKTVKRCKLSGASVLEETTFPGKYIPLVPVYGEEAWRDGKRHLLSLIRKAKEAQRMFNLGISLDIEMLMKQPQASFQAAAGTISGFEHEYADPSKANVLHYNQTDVNGQPAPPPNRVQAPTGSVGFIQMSANAVDNIKSTLGMYNAALGQRSNETSGKAINARKVEADVAVFHFSDNLNRSITHVGKIIVCAKDKIYDTPRLVKIVDKEENSKIIGINGKRAVEQDRDYNIKEGSYDVRVITGPSFATQRQEAATNYSQIVQAMPDLMPVIGDLVFKYQDSAGSQAISERLKKMIKKSNPDLLSEDEMGEDEVDPQVAALTQQLQAIQQEAQATIAQLQAELQNKQSEQQLKAGELQVKNKEVEIKAFEAQQKAQPQPVSDNSDVIIRMRELEIKEFEATEKARNEKARTTLEAEKLKLETFKAMQALNIPTEDNGVAEDNGVGVEQESVEKQMQMQMLDGIMATTQAVAQAMQGLTDAIQNPPPIQVVRDENGNITGAV